MKVRPLGTDCFMRGEGRTDKRDEGDSRFSEFGLKNAGANTVNSDTTKQLWGNSCAVGNLREYNGHFKFLGFAFKRHWEVSFLKGVVLFLRKS